MDHSFKFGDKKLTRRLIDALRSIGIAHCVSDDGFVQYSKDVAERIENGIICFLREGVFPSWQTLACPLEWTAKYKSYMHKHDIPFVEEWMDEELWFLIEGNRRPLSWKLDEGLKESEYRSRPLKRAQ